MANVSFGSLCAERDALRNFVLVHADSLLAFKEREQPWFRQQEADDKPDSRQIRHLSTTASCLESLSDVPVYDPDGKDPPPPAPTNGKDVKEKLASYSSDFATAALQAKDSEWQSEGAASVYCRVRTLPAILRLAPKDSLQPFEAKLKRHLRFVWKLLEIGNLEAQGIAELPKEKMAPKGPRGYPPNAFHTYWAVRLHREYTAAAVFTEPMKDMDKREAVARLWARRTLAAHTALISGSQRSYDAHQLAWALSTDILCRSDDGSAEGDQPTIADHQHIELYDAALAAFFSEQEDGRWRLYEPLFHYPRAGNAYCYTYETLAELLRLALRQNGGRIIRDHLRKYADNLIQAWYHARDTALALEDHGLGWCSGHHPHSKRPEAWATASVFSYLQNLRCLIGYWTAEEAKRDLSVKLSVSAVTAKAGRELIEERGNTWHRTDTHTVGRQFAMLFLNPIEAKKKEEPTIDPDRPLVDESRSAVLFGPPGTSKTSLVGGLAAALGWDYVEIHASTFLSEGMDSVPKRADAIFQQLMELDRCVIIFDEIDELIRVRDGDRSDPFGRFLTTSMLPKLAELWKQRRVLFFVATNDIEAADPAIKRSQRFDAAIFVPPPSFEKKVKELEKLLPIPVPSNLTLSKVEESLAGEGDPENAPLGVFALLRWDQISDLAHRLLEAERREKESSEEALLRSLGEMGEELELTDWHGSSPTDEQDYPFQEMFDRWRHQKVNERRDYRDVAALRLDDGLFNQKPSDWQAYGSNGHYLAIDHEIEAALSRLDDGSVELSTDGWKAADTKGIFLFEARDG
jgi:hypothetical protein